MISGLHATPINNRCPPASPELATRLPSPITTYTPNAGMRGNGGQAPGALHHIIVSAKGDVMLRV